MKQRINIGGRPAGVNEPCYIIAEAGVNHNGDISTARELIDAAVCAGADAVKFQSFKTGAIVTAGAGKAGYQKKTTGRGGTQSEMLGKLELTSGEQAELAAYSRAKGIAFISSPFDIESARMLKNLGLCCFKVASGCLTYSTLLREVGSYGAPVILSTGMADLDEVRAAVADLKSGGCDELILLHCVTEYPASFESVNLRAMLTMGKEFGVPCGYSDHTEGDEAPVAAVAIGACVIEKHITLDRKAEGPDHVASMECEDFRNMVRRIRNVELSMGNGLKVPSQPEIENRKTGRYSLVSDRSIARGSVITPKVLTAKRPGSGISPRLAEMVIGRKAGIDIQPDTVIEWGMLEPEHQCK